MRKQVFLTIITASPLVPDSPVPVPQWAASVPTPFPLLPMLGWFRPFMMRTSRNSWKKGRKRKMRVGGFEDPLPNFAPALLALPGPYLLQAAGVQLSFIDDLDGDLEVAKGRGEKVKLLQT